MSRIVTSSMMTAIAVLLSSPAWASSIARTSSFAYDVGTSLLNQEVVEPDTPAFCCLRSTTTARVELRAGWSSMNFLCLSDEFSLFVLDLRNQIGRREFTSGEVVKAIDGPLEAIFPVVA
jgi:hypothetical protein